MLEINEEQLDAASGHALKIITGQWRASAVPGDVMYATDGQELHGVAKACADRLLDQFQKARMRFCSHIIKRPAQPIFTRQWLMERAMCNTCLPRSGIRAPEGHRCLHCDGLNYRPGLDLRKRLNIQIWNAAMLSIYYGLCDGCADVMTAELKDRATEVL